ncbi:MAG TPA: chemotaxis protein CheW [Noviherbaspirillum sp.]|uniref:chemotaxis protein CheW n=1 Tax=Noviherbaspirillum sp. TaxID=1926288 RepID=UPI002B47A6EB|nr:chemotaxis protein CheW [Noviherbaspirillum sp.]HJV87158.1 chemotaxis protein CheW [Noviherbaspirillum sp.]
MNAVIETKAATDKQAAANQASGQTQYLTFMLGGEMFAIGILAVKEIIEYGGLTEVPMMPECIRGVINLRGAVVPVLDLSARFGKATTTVTKRTCIVIVEIENGGEQQVVGVVVDAVNAVLDIAAADIEPPPAFGAKIRTDFIEGMGKVNGKFVILLNLGQILSLDDIAALADVNAMAQSLIGNSTAVAA